ncbi:UNVERIFIED_CONTAM: hypothetical protein Cloal_0023 [Acetivibrio alkalicellulosi]
MTDDNDNINKIIDENDQEDQNDNRHFFEFGENIKRNNDTAVMVEKNSTLFVILGWICAALTVFISPLFAIPGVVFGVMLNRQIRGSGNILIITNTVLALISFSFNLIYILMTR